MNNSHNSHLISKILIIGVLIAALIYLFHPGVGQLSVIINGEPVPQPWAGLAAIPTMLLVLAISVMLGLLIFFGVGLFMFLGALFFAFFGVILIAPYFWPVLVIIFLVIALMSIGNGNRN